MSYYKNKLGKEIDQFRQSVDETAKLLDIVEQKYSEGECDHLVADNNKDICLALNAPIIRVRKSNIVKYYFDRMNTEYDWSSYNIPCVLIPFYLDILDEKGVKLCYVRFKYITNNVLGFIAHQEMFYNSQSFMNTSDTILRQWNIYTENSEITPLWTVLQFDDNTYSCNCPGWTKHKARSCKHTRRIREYSSFKAIKK